MVVPCCVIGCKNTGKHRVKSLVNAKTAHIELRNRHIVQRACPVSSDATFYKFKFVWISTVRKFRFQ